MKFLYSALLALAATGAQAQNPNPGTFSSADDLKDAWHMDNANIVYTEGDNKFTLTFATTDADSQFQSNVHINEEFYDKDCADTDGTGEVVITAGIVDPTNNSLRPQASQDPTSGAVTLEFELLPKILSQNSAIYTDNSGTGVLEFCVRTSLGYNGDDTAVTGRAKTLAQQVAGPNGFVEVNFIESLITVIYDLSSGFTTVSANVKPKDREGQTDQEDVYGLTAWICDKNNVNPHTYNDGIGGSFTRSYPDQLSYAFFNQGALIPVCIRPDDTAYTEGVIMKHIVDFTWWRNVPVYGNVTQEAIASAPGVVSDNRLTYHNGCVDQHYCLFESVLFADFYVTQGVVNGAGTAVVKFEGTRRLADGRKLQEVEDAGSPFDVDVPLASNEDGPGAIKTAGAVSFGLTALASAIALVSAGLMA